MGVRIRHLVHVFVVGNQISLSVRLPQPPAVGSKEFVWIDNRVPAPYIHVDVMKDGIPSIHWRTRRPAGIE